MLYLSLAGGVVIVIDSDVRLLLLLLVWQWLPFGCIAACADVDAEDIAVSAAAVI